MEPARVFSPVEGDAATFLAFAEHTRTGPFSHPPGLPTTTFAVCATCACRFDADVDRRQITVSGPCRHPGCRCHRLTAMLLSAAIGVRCSNPAHDHLTATDDQGRRVFPPVPMVCDDCGRPSYYDEATGDYWHAVERDAACFLVMAASPDDDAMPCGPAVASFLAGRGRAVNAHDDRSARRWEPREAEVVEVPLWDVHPDGILCPVGDCGYVVRWEEASDPAVLARCDESLDPTKALAMLGDEHIEAAHPEHVRPIVSRHSDATDDQPRSDSPPTDD